MKLEVKLEDKGERRGEAWEEIYSMYNMSVYESVPM